MANKIKVSIITVILNAEKTIDKTIKSVLSQNYKNIEYIIIDGGSIDGTIEIVNKYRSHIDIFLSEKDDGIYSGMNKGIEISKGELVVLLNGDDEFIDPNVIKELVENFNENEILISNTLISTQEKITMAKVGAFKDLYLRVPFMHTSCFVPRNIYKNIGLYSTSYKISSDIDWIFRAIKQEILFRDLKRPLIIMKSGGISSKKYVLARKEYRDIYNIHFKNKLIGYYGYILSLFDFYVLNPLVKIYKFFNG